MSIKLPRKEWFDFEDLAIEWNTTIKEIEHLVETHKLKSKFMVKEYSNIFWWETEQEAIDWLSPDQNPVDHIYGPFCLLSEVERLESLFGKNGIEEQLHVVQPTITNIEEFIADNRGKMSDEELIFHLREAGFQNNKIGVALGGTFRKDSNALATKISRKYNKYKKKLGT